MKNTPAEVFFHQKNFGSTFFQKNRFFQKSQNLSRVFFFPKVLSNIFFNYDSNFTKT